MGADDAQPLVDLAAEEAVFGMNVKARLFFQATQRVGELNHYLPFHGDAVLIDFGVKSFAKSDRVGAVA